MEDMYEAGCMKKEVVMGESRSRKEKNRCEKQPQASQRLKKEENEAREFFDPGGRKKQMARRLGSTRTSPFDDHFANSARVHGLYLEEVARKQARLRQREEVTETFNKGIQAKIIAGLEVPHVKLPKVQARGVEGGYKKGISDSNSGYYRRLEVLVRKLLQEQMARSQKMQAQFSGTVESVLCTKPEEVDGSRCGDDEGCKDVSTSEGSSSESSSDGGVMLLGAEPNVGGSSVMDEKLEVVKGDRLGWVDQLVEEDEQLSNHQTQQQQQPQQEQQQSQQVQQQQQQIHAHEPKADSEGRDHRVAGPVMGRCVKDTGGGGESTTTRGEVQSVGELQLVGASGGVGTEGGSVCSSSTGGNSSGRGSSSVGG